MLYIGHVNVWCNLTENSRWPFSALNVHVLPLGHRGSGHSGSLSVISLSEASHCAPPMCHCAPPMILCFNHVIIIISHCKGIFNINVINVYNCFIGIFLNLKNEINVFI